MSKMSHMDMYMQTTVAYVDAGEDLADALEAVRIAEDLDAGEYRNLIKYAHDYYRQESLK